jgi:hypothetical protein
MGVSDLLSDGFRVWMAMLTVSFEIIFRYHQFVKV